MRSFWRILSQPVYIPFVDKAEDAYRAFSPSGRSLFLFLSTLLIVSSLSLLYILNSTMLVQVPAHGGTLSEGIIGSPRFINPVLAISDADRDLSALVYSGLLHATPQGEYIPDTAESYTISPDGKTYTVILKKNAVFHDGTPVTADDVIFTIAKTQDPALKSPLRANWDGVVVEEVDTHTVHFTLKSPYTPFIENLTIGILPKHLWQNVNVEEFPFSELNVEPVGSGPFRISSISRTASGIPASYELRGFDRYALGAPYLYELTLRFYQSESALVSALNSGQIEAASGISPAALSKLEGQNIERSSLNRVFAVFFNQNQSEILRDVDVRRALTAAVDRTALVEQVLGGYGTALSGPVPPTTTTLSHGAGVSSSTQESLAHQSDLALDARDMLVKKGWVLGSNGILQKTTGTGKKTETKTLSFSISKVNVPELRAAAELLRSIWREMGADVEIKIFDQGDLSQNVIRPRKYDSLLFGEVIGRELDLFAFWHSSQRNDPGLNVALYANATADKVLERLRTSTSDADQKTLYKQFTTELDKDIPAVFLYAPDFVYSIPKTIQGLDLGFIETPSDRFLSVAQWHRETDYVWPFFVKQ